MSKVSAFLPCRKGSQRIKNKNIKPFGGIEGGLVRIKLLQLAKANSIEKIYLSTNDNEIIKIAQELNIHNLIIDQRPEYLCTSETTTDELIKYVPKLINSDHILWTHVTSPFIDEVIYEKAIEEYFLAIYEKRYDSLMSVTKLKKFIWNDNEPINYNRDENKWPFTQSIKPLYEVNSGIFLSSRENYQEFNDRIGLTPLYYELDSLKSFDIDWEEDFIIAEAIIKL